MISIRRPPRWLSARADAVAAHLDRLAPPPPWLARAIALSAEQIATDPKWLQPDTSSNPQPIGHLRAMIDASQRLGHSEEVDAAIQKLRASLQGLPDGSARSQALDAIGH